MQIADFALERYFARWEFAVRYVLCASDVEGLTMHELLAMADDETRALWERLTLGYTESLGHPLLRREIASLYASADAEDVITFVGAEEGIFLALHALLEAGDHAVVVWPSYQSLSEVARSVGAAVTLVPLDPHDWSLDVGVVRRVVTPRTRVIIVNYPHNPTGALLDRASFQSLVQFTEERGITLLSDEVYRYLERDESQRLPAAIDQGRRTVSLGVLSKSFALAGLRIGWIASHDRSLIARIARLKDYTTICGSAPSEILGIMALRAREKVLARSRAIVAANLPLLHAFFARMADRFRWVPPVAGSVAFPELIDDDVDRFCEALLEHEGVLLLPASRFVYASNHFRLGFGRRDMPAALERLERFTASHRAVTR